MNVRADAAPEPTATSSGNPDDIENRKKPHSGDIAKKDTTPQSKSWTRPRGVPVIRLATTRVAATIFVLCALVGTVLASREAALMRDSTRCVDWHVNRLSAVQQPSAQSIIEAIGGTNAKCEEAKAGKGWFCSSGDFDLYTPREPTMSLVADSDWLARTEFAMNSCPTLISLGIGDYGEGEVVDFMEVVAEACDETPECVSSLSPYKTKCFCGEHSYGLNGQRTEFRVENAEEWKRSFLDTANKKEPGGTRRRLVTRTKTVWYEHGTGPGLLAGVTVYEGPAAYFESFSSSCVSNCWSMNGSGVVEQPYRTNAQGQVQLKWTRPAVEPFCEAYLWSGQDSWKPHVTMWVSRSNLDVRSESGTFTSGCTSGSCWWKTVAAGDKFSIQVDYY